MKNLTKRFVSLLMCFLMLVMLLPTTAVAAGTFDVSAGKVSAENTVGAKTDVPIMLDNNPGVTAVKIKGYLEKMVVFDLSSRFKSKSTLFLLVVFCSITGILY